jgi:hypothetical protein
MEVMMFVKGVPEDSSLLKVREILLHSRKKLDSHKVGKPYVPVFDILLTQWGEVFKKSLEITDEQAIARAFLEFADVLLDDVVDQFDEATEDLPTLRELLFEGVAPSTLKRPIVGNQLKKLQQWIPRLQGDLPEEIKKLLPALVEAVDFATKAVKAEEEATEKQKAFQITGAKRQFIDTINKTRNDTFLSLSKEFEEESPAYRASLARRFLVKIQETTTYQNLDDQIADIKEQLDEAKQNASLLESRYQELVTKREQQAQSEQEEQTKEARLVALRQEAAALEAELSRTKKRKKK